MQRRPNIGNRAAAFMTLGALTALGSPAQTLTTLISFDGKNGAYPHGSLIEAANGDLYGTTSGIGKPSHPGTVFKIKPGGALKSLHTFCSLGHCADGRDPEAALLQATDGNLYGTTFKGGANGVGTVFKITPGGTLTTLYSFCSVAVNCEDGEIPEAGLVQATDGNLYGTAQVGGAHGGGTVFQITPSGTLTTIYSFCSSTHCEDGESPMGGLVAATDGNLYGTTVDGGAHGGGTVFQITPSGALTTLYSFCSLANCADGVSPFAGLVQASNGDFYGTTFSRGANGSGTVFQITPGGTLTTLYNFCSQPNCADGVQVWRALLQAADGNLYGNTFSGGAHNWGTIFQITPAGTFRTIYSFCSKANCADGSAPEDGLVQAKNGDLYGTTASGGSSNSGTVFRLSIGRRRFAEGLCRHRS